MYTKVNENKKRSYNYLGFFFFLFIIVLHSCDNSSESEIENQQLNELTNDKIKTEKESYIEKDIIQAPGDR